MPPVNKQNFSSKLELLIEGYHAALRKKPFNPKMPAAWQEGYRKQKQGYVLTDHAIRMVMGATSKRMY